MLSKACWVSLDGILVALVNCKDNANFLIAEDNMNVQLKDIVVTARDGRVSHLDQIYVRGSHVRFFIVPDMLRYVRLVPLDYSIWC